MTSDSNQQLSDVTKRITVTLDDELHDWVAAKAEREERTVPNYLAWLAKRAYLEEAETSPISTSMPTATAK
jgi:hypothetical protein